MTGEGSAVTLSRGAAYQTPLAYPKCLSYISRPNGQVAQLVEQRTENPRVGGSIPSLAMSKAQRSNQSGNELRDSGLVAAFWCVLNSFQGTFQSFNSSLQ